VAWILRLVKTGADGENQSADVMTINRPDDLGNIANFGLTLAEGKLLLAGLQREHAILWSSLRCQSDDFIAVCWAETWIATTEDVLERIVQHRCSHVEKG
jgi:hypothetical protein